jgi:hypothetical protein
MRCGRVKCGLSRLMVARNRIWNNRMPCPRPRAGEPKLRVRVAMASDPSRSLAIRGVATTRGYTRERLRQWTTRLFDQKAGVLSPTRFPNALMEPLESRSLLSATYFVSPTGNDANTGVDAAHAWRHIQKAFDAAAPGSTVNVLPGRYNEKPARRRGEARLRSGGRMTNSRMRPLNYPLSRGFPTGRGPFRGQGLG